MRLCSLCSTAALLVAALALTACSVSTTTEADADQPTERPPADLLHQPGAAARAVAAIERKVGGAPARATDVLIYPEYMDVKAQDPQIAEHIDEYEWRDDTVTGPEAVHLSGPQEEVDASLFPTTAVRWSQVPRFVRDVETRARHARPTRIEDTRASYLIVDRSTSPDDDGRVEIRIYLDGPRRSGSAELTASGDIVSLSVS